jgi:N-carbamoylputrescine amidase
VLACNRVGDEHIPGSALQGARFWGSSFIAGAQGELLAQAPADLPAVICAELDLARSEHVRRIWPFLRDRRIDAYEDLTRRVRD